MGNYGTHFAITPWWIFPEFLRYRFLASLAYTWVVLKRRLKSTRFQGKRIFLLWKSLGILVFTLLRNLTPLMKYTLTWTIEQVSSKFKIFKFLRFRVKPRSIILISPTLSLTSLCVFFGFPLCFLTLSLLCCSYFCVPNTNTIKFFPSAQHDASLIQYFFFFLEGGFYNFFRGTFVLFMEWKIIGATFIWTRTLILKVQKFPLDWLFQTALGFGTKGNQTSSYILVSYTYFFFWVLFQSLLFLTSHPSFSYF